MVEIGTYIRRYRHEKRLSMEYVASEIGVSYQAYSQYENGKVKLMHPSLLKICKVLEIDPVVFFSGETKEKTIESEQVEILIPEYLNNRIKDLEKRVEDLVAQNAVLSYKLSLKDGEVEESTRSKKVG